MFNILPLNKKSKNLLRHAVGRNSIKIHVFRNYHISLLYNLILLLIKQLIIKETNTHVLFMTSLSTPVPELSSLPSNPDLPASQQTLTVTKNLSNPSNSPTLSSQDD